MDMTMLGLASPYRKRRDSDMDQEAKRQGRFNRFVELAKRRRGSCDDVDASYWDLLPYELQERIVKESEIMEDMEKAREKARQWEQVHRE